jgi:ABC-type transport system involved in cytochrome c biogenesis permease subunit
MTFVEKITIFCFAASYGVAFMLDMLHALRSRPVLRVLSLIFGSAGLLAHTLYIAVQPLSLADRRGSLLFLAWILAVFYAYGSFHHKRVAWGLFALPMVLGLIVLSVVLPPDQNRIEEGGWTRFFQILQLHGEKFWGWVHGLLLLFAAVGVCVGCVASIMYLVQVRRLRTKMAPTQGMRMLSLERIEAMNRRAILWAFPFLTAGLLVGVALKLHQPETFWTWDPKLLSGLGLWFVFAVLLYLRYSVHVRGRQAAWWTLIAFVVLVAALVSPGHSFSQGVEP